MIQINVSDLIDFYLKEKVKSKGWVGYSLEWDDENAAYVSVLTYEEDEE